MPSIPLIVWNGSGSRTPTRIISYVRGQRLVSNGCLANFTFVCDVSREGPKVDLVPVVREFTDVFPTNLLSLLSKSATDFE